MKIISAIKQNGIQRIFAIYIKNILIIFNGFKFIKSFLIVIKHKPNSIVSLFKLML